MCVCLYVLLRSPGGTPLGGWKKNKTVEPEMISYFNTKLLDKFRNIRSPTPVSPASLNNSSQSPF